MQILRSVPDAASSPVALTIGNFDGVHLGHQAMLAKLRAAALAHGLPACVMTFEPHPREFFAPDQAPVRLTSMREKLELLRSHGVARTHVLRFNFALAQVTAADFIERILVRGLGVRWLQVGDDFRFGARRAGDLAMLRAQAAQHGYEVEGMATVELDGARVSSTAVRDALSAGDVGKAARLLGRPYSISGRVIGGDRLGRELGFPTANVQMKHNRPPLTGIFAVELRRRDGRPLQGVASLGVRPTVKASGAAPVLEVFIFDFKEDIYGELVCVDFLHKFRDEAKYVDLETLKTQIARDVSDTRAYFAKRAA
ncbi:MAG: bifunctional riboflavin kinase/FAD synthetase [Burkholderiales bacterium]|nr:bifunctional riboflavin kinase/FAD synthetase [Burkholderiales bacterium]MDP2396943.1 bifunctional riboflavin kinase/FAD synthetase [Burkholderiales bacterium]